MITKYDLYTESIRTKRGKELLEKFLSLFEKHSFITAIDSDVVNEISQEYEILYFLYSDYRDLYYWGNQFEKEDRNLTKTVVKKFVAESLSEKWEHDYKLYYQVKDFVEKMNTSFLPYINISTVLKTILRKYKPEKLQKIEDFNL